MVNSLQLFLYYASNLFGILVVLVCFVCGTVQMRLDLFVVCFKLVWHSCGMLTCMFFEVRFNSGCLILGLLVVVVCDAPVLFQAGGDCSAMVFGRSPVYCSCVARGTVRPDSQRFAR